MLFVIAGCRATYTDENIAQSIVNLCKKEHNMGVKVKRVGRTLGIYLPIEGLFESTTKIKNYASLEDILAGIRFTKEAADKIDNVSLVLSRVALSTDAAVDFYVLIVADTKGTGIQIIITRYARDMKRLVLGDVSRGDYIQRLLMDMDFGPAPGAEATVRDFFYDIERLPMQALINRYFSKTTNARAVSPDFFLYLSEMSNKQSKRFHIKDLKTRQIEKTRILAKCRVTEVYTPAPGYENFKFLYPSGFQNEYLILLDTAYTPYMIEEIYPEGSYPAKFARYENPAAWEDAGFFLEEVKVPDFLARQLANRVKDLYQSDPILKNKFVINFVKGEYQPAAKKFKILFDVENKKRRRASVEFGPIWKIISQVMRRYEFKEFESVELMNIADAKREFMARDELLNRFWPKWLLRR